MAPAGTPRAIVDKLSGAVHEALASDETVAKLKAQGFDTLEGGPEEFARTIAADSARWATAARAAGLTQ